MITISTWIISFTDHLTQSSLAFGSNTIELTLCGMVIAVNIYLMCLLFMCAGSFVYNDMCFHFIMQGTYATVYKGRSR